MDAYTSGLSLIPPEGPSSYIDTPSLLHLDNCLRLLDSCLLGSWSITEGEVAAQAQKLHTIRNEGFAKSVIALCVSCNIIFQDNNLEERRVIGESRQKMQNRSANVQSAARCVESSLRVLINLTHEDIPWCRALLEDDLSMPTIMNLIIVAQRQRRILEKRADADEADSNDVDSAAHCLDRLCLALGLLTNLVQATPEGRHIIGNTCMSQCLFPL